LALAAEAAEERGPRTEGNPNNDEAAESEELAMIGTGQLRVISTQGFLQVSVDGIDRGLTPVQPFDLPAGRHRVRTIETEYTLAQTHEVVIPPDEQTTLRLEPNYKPSTIKLQGFPAGAQIHLDGRPLGEVRSLRLNSNRTYAIDVYIGDVRVQTASVIRGVERGQLLPGSLMTIPFRGEPESKLPESP
jgi:hypothetical protein